MIAKPKRCYLLLAAALGIAGVAALVFRSQALPVGPQPIVWDGETCSECRMLVSDPHFAAQLQTEGGEVLDFDDPGCLMKYIKRNHPRVRAVYFHHLTQLRWLDAGHAAFVPVSGSPMGHGIGAVESGVKDSAPYARLLKQGNVETSAKER